MKPADRPLIGALAAAACLAAVLRGNVPFASWSDGTIPMVLQLDAPGRPALPSGGLADGSSNWNNAILPALTAWNTHMARTKFTHTLSSSGTASFRNGVNNVTFSSTIYGQAFPSRVLAVTLLSSDGVRGVRLTEADVIFNTAISWDSYRGGLGTRTDIRRVAMHEFGHALGLDHPDEDHPPQSVEALMNSTISHIETAMADDIAGARRLYDVSVPVPVFTAQPAGVVVNEGAAAALVPMLDGAPPPPASPTRQYSWFFTPTGHPEEFLFTVETGTLPLTPAQLTDAGTYYVVVETPQGSVQSALATVQVAPVARDSATRLANLSTRGLAGAGDRALIVGFVVSGDSPARPVLIRAVGPTLASDFGVAGAIPDPRLTLEGRTSGTLAVNNDWGQGGGGTAAELMAAFEQAGAFALPGGSLDSALITQLGPGVYTALVESLGGTEGIALVECYDLDPALPGRLLNLSTRGHVGTEDTIMVAGFVVTGTGPRSYILRAAGDSLAVFGVPGYLDDTYIRLYDPAGNLLRVNDDWDSPQFLQPSIETAFALAGAFPFADRQESVLRLTLRPGVYTLQVSGFGGSTGVALVEIYEEE